MNIVFLILFFCSTVLMVQLWRSSNDSYFECAKEMGKSTFLIRINGLSLFI